MNTKIMSVFVMAVLMMSFLSVGVMAQEEITTALDGESEVSTDAGITPNSALYGLDKAMDRLSLALTFQKAKKAKKALEIADERLAEAEEMADSEEEEAMAEAQEAHDEMIAEAETATEEIESNGDVETAETALEDVAEIQKQLETHAQKVERVKTAILERKRANMSEEQIAHLEEVFGKIMAKAQTMEAKMVQKRDKAKIKYKVLAGMNDEELEEFMAGVDEKAQERVQKRIETRTRTESGKEAGDTERVRAEKKVTAADEDEAEDTETEESETAEADDEETESGEAIQLQSGQQSGQAE